MDHFSYQGSSAIPGSHHHHHHQQQQQQQHQQQQPLTPISNLTSHAFSHDSSVQPNILPPLNGHNHAPPSYHTATYKSGQHNDPHTSRVPHTPDTPSNAEQHQLPHLAPQSHMHVREPQVGTYPTGTTYGYQDTSPTYYHSPAQPQGGYSAAPASVGPYSQPPQAHINTAQHAVQDRHDLPPPSYYGPQAQTAASLRQSDQKPMPVVGSQGRRGILPSANGNAPPVGSSPDGSFRGAQNPSKNAENKYPCMFCNKTYLHLKHLKRHHLRHTGERPYQCSLCHETFCRSDILKRHFAKCAIRRGNPSGANHLTHAQAHLQKPPRSAPNSANGASAPPPLSGLSISTSQPPSSYNPSGPWSAITPRSSASTQLDQSQFPSSVNDSNRTSRSSSFMGPDMNGDEDRKRFSTGTNLPPINGHAESQAGHGTGTDHRPFSYPVGADQRHVGHGIREPHANGFYNHSTMAPPAEPVHSGPTYMRSNGWPPYNQPTTQEHHTNWSNCFTPGGQDAVMYNGH